MTQLFQSFFMGGFECATHRRRDGARIDVLATTGHAACSAIDYRLLQQAGIRTVRDGLRWHLIEATPGVYDWSSFLPMLDASLATGTQVLWDLCHWGVPHHIDVFSDEFAPRFAAFAGAAASLIRERSGGTHAPVPFYCPVNEISFWSWVGGDMEGFAPHGRARGDELKGRLIEASLAAIEAVRKVDPRARFLQAEPIIHIAPEYADVPEYPEILDHVRGHVAGQYQAWDMLRGDLREHLGGTPEMLDIIGVNYYWNNQWVHGGDRMPPGHPDHRPLHTMLQDLWQRYRRPIVISETGAESAAAVGWLGYIAAEIRQAQREGVEVLGVCLYPVMDYPGWDDERHCSCGLIEVSPDWTARKLRGDLAAELQAQNTIMQPLERNSASEILPAR